MSATDQTHSAHDDGGDEVALGFGDLSVSTGAHIGHFYESRDEWKNVVVSFLVAGLEANHKCVYVINPGAEKEELVEALADRGVDVESRSAAGDLQLRDGSSDPQELQESLGQALSDIPGKYPLLRWGGDMTWSLDKIATSETLMEWEIHCNVIEGPQAVFLCQYDLRRFLGSVVMDALKTHPICIVSNSVHRNPYYQEPEIFLRDLRSKESVTLAP